MVNALVSVSAIIGCEWILKFQIDPLSELFWIKKSMANEILSNPVKNLSLASNGMSCRQTNELPIHIVPCVQNILCYAISGNAFIYYFQINDTTSRRCLSHLMRGIACCRALADVYLMKPRNFYARNIVALHDWVNDIPGMMGSWMLLKSTGKIALPHWRDSSKVMRRLLE